MPDDGDGPVRPLSPNDKEQVRLRQLVQENEAQARAKENIQKYGEKWREKLDLRGISSPEAQDVIIADAAICLAREQGRPHRLVPPDPTEYIPSTSEEAQAKAAELLENEEKRKNTETQSKDAASAQQPPAKEISSNWSMAADEVLGRFEDPAARMRYHQEDDQRRAHQASTGGNQAGKGDEPSTPPTKPVESKSAEQEEFEKITSRFTRGNIEHARKAAREITGRNRGGRQR